MHELLAPLLYAVDFDSVDNVPGSVASTSSSSASQFMELCDREWIAADAHSLFEEVMSNIGSWYEWQESPPTAAASSAQGGPVNLKPYVAPIVSTCHQIHDEYLKRCDPALWDALSRSQIEPQIYGM